MGRFCYCSQILPGKTEIVRHHWKNKPVNKSVELQKAEISFWQNLKMTGFESWLQPTSKGDFMIHCVEGESLQQIFKGLRDEIAKGNPIALGLQNFYQTVLGKNYGSPDAEPQIERQMDISLLASFECIKRAFFYPLLPGKEEAYFTFRKEAMGIKRARHEAMMKSFKVRHLSTWLQSTSKGKFIIVYTERWAGTPEQASERLKQGEESREWQEIAAELTSYTGLKFSELSPDVEWLTQKPVEAAV